MENPVQRNEEITVIRRSILAAALVIAFSAPAMAFHCPADVAAINHALGAAHLTAEQVAQVESLRDEGEALHNAGSHQDSVDKLAEAMRIILNNM